MQPTATVIGDVVGSKKTDDRAALHRALSHAIEQVNQHFQPAVPLRITVGDEYQGCFDTVGAAVRATLRLQLSLAPVQVRHGIGWGAVAVLADQPRVEDGPGWWAARAAIERVASEAERPAMRELRTGFAAAEPEQRLGSSDLAGSGPDPDLLNAALLLRDRQVGQLSERGANVALALLEGESQTTIAERLRISGSAVSQRVRSDGLAMLIAADDRLGRVR